MHHAAVEAAVGHVTLRPTGPAGPEPAADLRAQAGRSLRAAFEVEPARRRRFMLTFNNKSRWQAQAAEKKTM
jgi:hypothetical protein